MIDRRGFLRAGGAAMAAGVVPSLTTLNSAAADPLRASPGARRPNVVVFMADDLGYSDVGCFGSEHIATPVLDRLAERGTRFTNFYAGAPNCSPSRACLMTGRIPTRTGMYSYRPGSSPMHLPAGERTIATLLQGAGYDTCHVGKWHLSGLGSDQPQPNHHGFEYWLGTSNNAAPSHRNPRNFFRNGRKLGEVEGYACQIVADEAIGWLRDQRRSGGADKPFFLNVWFHEPHAKVAAPPAMAARHKGVSKRDAEYFGCIENMDAAIGRVLKALDELGVADETFVLFTSDNGSYRGGSNGSLRGAKSWTYEGGIRAPGIVRWPGHVKAGATDATPAGVVDLLPTICAMAGVSVPSDRPIDGTSLLPVFEGKAVERKTPLFWFFYRTDPACAMRMGDWSLVGYLNEKVPPGHGLKPDHVTYLKRAKLDRFELYNLRDDPSQKTDLAAKHPDRLASMKQRMVELHEQVVNEGPQWYEDKT